MNTNFASGIASRDVPKQSTITDKAIRLHGTAQDVLNKMSAIHSRTVPPQPALASEGKPRPPCDHAVFALEDAQQMLDSANMMANEILDRL